MATVLDANGLIRTRLFGVAPPIDGLSTTFGDPSNLSRQDDASARIADTPGL